MTIDHTLFAPTVSETYPQRPAADAYSRDISQRSNTPMDACEHVDACMALYDAAMQIIRCVSMTEDQYIELRQACERVERAYGRDVRAEP